MGKQNEVFRTVSRGFDKEEVQRYLQEMTERYADRQQEMEETLTAQEQVAAKAVSHAGETEQELGEALYQMQKMNRELETLRRQKDDAEKKTVLAERLMSGLRSEVTAANSVKEELEHSLKEEMEKNIRLEKKLAEQPAPVQSEDAEILRRQLEEMQSEMAVLRARNEELESHMERIRRKVLDAAKARQARGLR